jgi:hypothetical protein
MEKQQCTTKQSAALSAALPASELKGHSETSDEDTNCPSGWFPHSPPQHSGLACHLLPDVSE